MPDPYQQLLEATIQHLEKLQSRGVQFVNVPPQTLAALKQQDASARPPSRRVIGFAPSAPAGGVVRPANATRGAVTAKVLSPERVPIPPPTGEPKASRLSPEAKAAAFAELRNRVIPCTKCAHLAASRKNVVFGVGNLEAELMFVGEAPGADEDQQGEPFVGKAGQLLTKIIQTMGLSRSSVYIANILKCRPDTPGKVSGNRKPTPEEMQTCLPFLQEQIDLIQPKVLVALGGTAVEGLLGKTIGITRLRGQWRTYRGIPLMPTYHPAYLLHNEVVGEKRRVWEDMLQVMERLGLPISDKQRGYFL